MYLVLEWEHNAGIYLIIYSINIGGFRTWGNADAMAQKSNYRGRDFKIIRNTKDFVPQPGDWGVWTGGWAGHVNIVVGPCTKDYWYGVDQNWYTNNATGSPPYKIKHSYHDGPGGGVKYFVRPPYHPDKNYTST